MTYSLSSLEKKGGVITGSGLIGVRGEGGGGGGFMGDLRYTTA